jgi:hypothetical protein
VFKVEQTRLFLTSSACLIILASVRLEMPVAAITLEPTLFKGIFMPFLA